MLFEEIFCQVHVQILFTVQTTMEFKKILSFFFLKTADNNQDSSFWSKW